jgi:hypothetical protein
VSYDIKALAIIIARSSSFILVLKSGFALATKS